MAIQQIIDLIVRGNSVEAFNKSANAAKHFSGVVASSTGPAKQLQAALEADAQAAEKFAREMGKIKSGASSAWSPQISNAHKAAAETRKASDEANRVAQSMVSVGQQAAAGLDEATSSAEDLGKSLETVSKVAAAGVVMGGVNMLVSGLIQSGQEAANAQKKLEAMLNVRGESESFEELNKAISNLSKQTGLDDDVFADASAHLLSFGLTAKQVGEILPGAFSQSKTMGQDLISVVDAIGRGVASLNASGMRRSGIVISPEDIANIEKLKKAGDTVGAQKAIFAALQKSFKEYAVSIGDGLDSSAVKMGRFQNAVDDVTETIGKGAGDARAAWQAALTPTIESLNEHNEGLLRIAGSTMEVGTQAMNVITPLAGVIEAYHAWRVAANTAKIASLQANAAAAAGGLAAGAAVGGGAALAGAGVAGAAGAGAGAAGAAGAGAAAAGGGGLLANIAAGGATALGAASAGGIALATGGGLALGTGVGYGLYRAGQSVGLIDREQGFGDRMATGWGRFRDFVTRNPGNYDREVNNRWRGDHAEAQIARMNAGKRRAQMAGLMASGAFSDETGDEGLIDTQSIIDRATSGGATLMRSSGGRRAHTEEHATDQAAHFSNSIDIERLQSGNEISRVRIEEATKGRLERERASLETQLKSIERMKDSKAITGDKAGEMADNLRKAYERRNKVMEAEADYQIAQIEAQEEIAKAQLNAATQTGQEQKATIERAKIVANKILTVAKMRLDGVRESLNEFASSSADSMGRPQASGHMMNLMRGMPQADAANWIAKMSHGHRTNAGDYGAGAMIGSMLAGKDPRSGMVEGFKSLDEERDAMNAFKARFGVAMRGGAPQLPQLNYSGINALSQGYRGYNGYSGESALGNGGVAGNVAGIGGSNTPLSVEISPELSLKRMGRNFIVKWKSGEASISVDELSNSRARVLFGGGAASSH